LIKSKPAEKGYNGMFQRLRIWLALSATRSLTHSWGRVSDLSDPLVIEIIKLYSDLPVLLQIIGALNQRSAELSKDDGSAQQAQRIRAILSIVIALSVQFNGFLTRIHGLVARLPGDALDSSARKDQSEKSRAG
jgi:hypothetical protein